MVDQTQNPGGQEVNFTPPAPAGPLHSADKVAFSPSGLAIVTGTDVQSALAELDAAVNTLQSTPAPAQGIELGYAEKNDQPFNSVTAYPNYSVVPGLLLAFAAPARPYMIQLTGDIDNNTLNALAVLSLQESLDNGVTWSVIQYDSAKQGTAGVFKPCNLRRRRNPAEGTEVQYRAGLSIITGGQATLQVDATANFPSIVILNAVML